MRLCPSVEGSASPLITHRIGADVCLSRQATNFHKCHRCIYRGQTADWQSPDDEQNAIDLRVEDAHESGGKRVVIPRPGTGAPARVAANG